MNISRKLAMQLQVWRERQFGTGISSRRPTNREEKTVVPGNSDSLCHFRGSKRTFLFSGSIVRGVDGGGTGGDASHSGLDEDLFIAPLFTNLSIRTGTTKVGTVAGNEPMAFYSSRIKRGRYHS